MHAKKKFKKNIPEMQCSEKDDYNKLNAVVEIAKMPQMEFSLIF